MTNNTVLYISSRDSFSNPFEWGDKVKFKQGLDNELTYGTRQFTVGVVEFDFDISNGAPVQIVHLQELNMSESFRSEELLRV